jgi:hypothetical protein
MEITVFRDAPLAHEPRSLPAAEYKLARILQARSTSGVAFVPIRSMQVLAILDAEEFVFVDSQYKQLAVLAWQRFRPQQRDSLDQPVPFEAMYYRADAALLQNRLQPELFKAMQVLARRGGATGPAQVLNFVRPLPPGDADAK